MLGSLITYLKYFSILIAIILPVIYLIKKNPDFAFWFFLNIYFDPGGFFAYYFGGKLSVFYIYDIAIIPIIFCLIVVDTNYRIIFKDRFFMKFLKVFMIFAAYFFIVYGAIIPYLNNDLNYIVFLQKNRTFIHYIIIVIAVYVFAMRGLKYFYLTTLFIGLFTLCTFLVSLLGGLNILPIVSEERYEGEGMMRIGILSWGLFSMFFPISFIIYLFSRRIKLNIKFRKLVYFVGMLMLVTLLIALSRRNFIGIPGTILIIILFSSYIFRSSKALALGKILFPLGLVLIIINFTLPKYIDYITEVSQDTFLLLTRGTDTRGEKEYRVSGTDDLEVTKKYISDNFIWGTGYSYLYWGEHGYATSSRGPTYALAMDAAGEVPIYYIFFGFGLAGFIIIVLLYSFLIRLFLRLFSLMKKKIILFTEHPYEVLFVIFVLYKIADRFTFSLYALGIDFTTTANGIFIGIGFALLRKLKIITSNLELSSSNNMNQLQESDTLQTLST